MSGDTDVLMITYNRPKYTRLALSRMLETCDESTRVWLWQNGSDTQTLDVVQSFLDHPRVYRFHHSSTNQKLREPTNWMWENSAGQYVAKVDDDCLVPSGWTQMLRRAHIGEPRLGVIACWPFQVEDLVPELADPKIQEFGGGQRVLQNCWVGGSGYMMKRACVEQAGSIREGESFPAYCIRLAAAGWVNGWYFPLLCQDHMDDPRSRNSLLRSDEDLARFCPLSAATFGVTTLEQWTEALKKDALAVQSASLNPRAHGRWGRRLHRLREAVRRVGSIRR